MKRFLLILLAGLMTLSCMITFSSCAAKPEMDLEDAAENLEGEDYIVSYVDDEDDLPVDISERLNASNSYGDFIYIVVYKDKKLADMAYDAYELNRSKAKDLAKAAQKDAKEHDENYNQNLVEEKYSSKEDKLEYKRVKYLLENYKRDLDDDVIERYKKIVDNYENGSDEVVYGKSGNIFWYGTKAAVKDSKG